MCLDSGSISPVHIIEQYGPLVSSIAYRMTRNSALAEDAAQEAWLQIFKRLPSFEGRSSLSTWIYTIASRTILRYMKSEKFVSLKRWINSCLQKITGKISLRGDVTNPLLMPLIEYNRPSVPRCL
jgi:RNA polymerase sigma factor (sigma-70 family)